MRSRQDKCRTSQCDTEDCNVKNDARWRNHLKWDSFRDGCIVMARCQVCELDFKTLVAWSYVL